MLFLNMLLPAFLTLSVLAPVYESPSIPAKSQALIKKLRIESGNSLTVKWNLDTQSPELLSGHLTTPSQHSPGWITYEYLDKVKKLYDLRRVKEDLSILSIEPSPDSTKVHLQRILFNKPVCGNQLLVELDRFGVIKRIEGKLHTGLEQKRLGRPMYAAITLDQARLAALAYDPLLKESEIINQYACYLPDRVGIPLVYKISFEKEKRPVSINVHSMTGRIIE